MSTLHTPLLRRSALALAISLGFAGAAQAQSAEGSLFGRTTAGAVVNIVNLDTGQQRQATTEASGSFTFSKLPPGRYRVTSGGITREVVVAIGSGTEVRLTAEELERIEISGRSRSLIDVSSVESNTVFTAEQMRTIPVARNVDAVALLAPGAVKGDPGLGGGGLASFGGASVGENGYYINGFDVTNIRNFLSYANLPFDAVEQQQIKSGGYGAEYGRSLGGVVSVLTKRGGNEWKAGAALYYKPNALRSNNPNVVDKDPDHPNSYTAFNSATKQTDLSYIAYAGGPIIKDKLFVFGMIEAHHDTQDIFRQDTSSHTLENKPKGLLKLDWAITDNHSLEYTGITNKKKTAITDYKAPTGNKFSSSHVGTPGDSIQTEGADVNILKYTGTLTQDLTVSAMIGKVRSQQPYTTGARKAGQDCPVVLDTDLTAIGCWTAPFPGPSVRDPKAPPFDTDTRKAGRLDVEWQLGSHQLRGGYDAQRFNSVAGGGSDYSGGYYYRYFISASGTVNGVPNSVPKGGQYVRRRESTQTSGAYDVNNTAFYAEDSWQVDHNWLLYGGLRSESFDNKNGDGVSFVKADNLIAPRLGFSWNVNGDSSLKIFSNLGRYYIPVASNTNIRATRGETFIQSFYSFTGRDPRTQAPLNMSSQIGKPQVINDGKLPDPGTVADTQLKPMNQDEFILGFQKSIARGLNAGAKIIRRKINDGMDDTCGAYAQKNWANDNGYKNFDAGTLAQCFLMNPGRDAHLKMDPNGDGNLTAVTIPAKYFNLAKYERTYNALELSLDKPFDGRWGFNATYTWSKSRGTAEGYVQSTLQQEDAGLTQDFDFGSLTDGAKGYLPNDRRHVIKAYGTYKVLEDWRVGGNLIIASGRPISCIGFVPDTVPDFNAVDGHSGSGAYTSASSYYCINPTTGKSELVPRGSRGRTPWTSQLDAQIAWTPKLGNGRLTVQVDVFNIFNTQKVVRVNEVADYSRATTTSTEAGKVNPNYLNPTDFQEGRSVLFTGRYEF